METVSVTVINFNGRATVLDTLRTIFELEGAEVQVQVIDDCSTDESVQMIRETYPDLPIHVQPHNTRKLNVLRNIALQKAETRLLLLTDNDILFERTCLRELMRWMGKDRSVATCTPRLMYWEEPDRIYRAGGRTHFIGAAVCPNRDELLSAVADMQGTEGAGLAAREPMLNAGGGILLLDREVACKAGGFDEDYMIGWGDDGEFYQRLMLHGSRCLYVPEAVAHHEAKPFTGARRARAVGQIYNRWQFILTHYAAVTLLLIGPALILHEIIQVVFMTLKGMLGLHLSGTWKSSKHLRFFLAKRKRIQAARTVSDRDILFCGPIYVSGAVVPHNPVARFGYRLTNYLFDIYWKLIKPCLPK